MSETETKSGKFTLNVSIAEDGTVDINTDGVCHHLFLLGVLESIKYDVLNVAAGMQAFVPSEAVADSDTTNE